MLPGSSQYPDNLRLSGKYSVASLFSPISQFHNLRILYSSSVVLNPGILQVLGDLPHLESLTAYSVSNKGYLDNMQIEVEDNEILIASLTLPGHSFPALQNLEIDCVPGEVISKLWQTPPLV